MVMTILRAGIDPTGGIRSQRGWHMQVLPQALLAVDQKDATSVLCCVKPGCSTPVAQEIGA